MLYNSEDKGIPDLLLTLKRTPRRARLLGECYKVLRERKKAHVQVWENRLMALFILIFLGIFCSHWGVTSLRMGYRSAWLVQSVRQATLDLRFKFKPHVGYRDYVKKKNLKKKKKTGCKLFQI